MSKDDYYVIVTKILVYLYKKYKQLEVDQDYILPMTKDFPIQKQQLFDTIEMMKGQGLIKGNVTKAWGEEIIAIDYSSLKILPGGIDYLQDNSKVRKICETLKEAKEIFSLFVWGKIMSKDDYYVIVYKILAYLYVQLKDGDDVDSKIISYNGSLFNIPEKYWTYIIAHLCQDGYIENVTIKKPWENVSVIENIDDIQITPKGIDYLLNNSLLEKAKEFLKDIKEITPFI